MMPRTHLLLPWLVVLAAPACAHTLGSAVRADQIGGKYARITGYMQTSALAPGGTWTEETRGAIRHDVILDEATLVKIAGETCVDVVVRTESARDEPLEQLKPTFAIDGEAARGVVESEVVSVYDYGFTGTREVVGVEGVAAEKFVALSVRQPEEQIFRVIERRARLCAGRGARSDVELNLEHPSWGANADAYELDFAWRIE
jgi:hypothetical protein